MGVAVQLVGTLSLASLTAGCKRPRKEPPSERATAATGTASAGGSGAAAQPPGSAAAAPEGSNALAGSTANAAEPKPSSLRLRCEPAAEATVAPMAVVSSVADLAIAAAGGATLVTLSVSGNSGCEHDGCYEFGRAYAVRRQPSGSFDPLASVPSSASGVSATEDATPFALGDRLLIWSQGHAGFAPLISSDRREPDTVTILEGSREIAASTKWLSGSFAVVGVDHGAIAIGAGAAVGAWRSGDQRSPAEVRSLRWREGGAIESTELHRGKGAIDEGGDRIYAPKLALGAADAAYAFILEPPLPPHASATGAVRSRTVWVGWLDRATGRAIGAPRKLVDDVVDAPALVISGTGLDVVYAAREPRSERTVLRAIHWASRETEPAPAVDLALPATAIGAAGTRGPALAAMGDSIALAWEKIDAAKTVTIHAGVGATLADAAAHAELVSGSGVVAMSPPALASDATRDKLAVAWITHDKTWSLATRWCAPVRE
jgi:hypothetical protein